MKFNFEFFRSVGPLILCFVMAFLMIVDKLSSAANQTDLASSSTSPPCKATIVTPIQMQPENEVTVTAVNGRDPAAASLAAIAQPPAPSSSSSLSVATAAHDDVKSLFWNDYLNLIKLAVTGTLFDEHGACVGESAGGCSETRPYEHDKRRQGLDWPAVGHTMIGHKRLDNIRMALEDVITNKVPGDFLEMGVWRGGACIFARAILNVYGEKKRKVHLFDAFGDIPGYGNPMKYLSVTINEVKHNLEKYGVTDGSVFHKGMFKDTVPSFAKAFTGQIAVLRVDGNYYDSYQDAMYYLYDKVPVGGYVIFDDLFDHPAVQRFWNDFKTEQGLPEDFIPIDRNAAYFKKTKQVSPDFKFFRPPQDANIVHTVVSTQAN